MRLRSVVDGRRNGSGAEKSDHGSPLGVDSGLSKGSGGEHVDYCEDVGEDIVWWRRGWKLGGGVVGDLISDCVRGSLEQD